MGTATVAQRERGETGAVDLNSSFRLPSTHRVSWLVLPKKAPCMWFQTCCLTSPRVLLGTHAVREVEELLPVRSHHSWLYRAASTEAIPRSAPLTNTRVNWN